MSQTPKQSSREVLDSRKSRRRAINGQESTLPAPLPLRETINSSLHFQNSTGPTITSETDLKDNSPRTRSTQRKSRRQRLEISSRVDPTSCPQRTRKPQILGKQLLDNCYRSQLLEGNMHDRHDYYQQAVEELPPEGTYIPSGKRQALLGRGKMLADESMRSAYPSLPPTLFRRLPPPNMRDFSRATFPMPGFNPAFGGAPPGFYLPPQAASGTGAPPGFYVPLQAVPGNGIPPGFIPHGFHSSPHYMYGVNAVPRCYPPPPITAGATTPGAIYPFPQVPIGVTGTPFGFYPPLHSVPGFGPPSRFYSPSSQPINPTPMMLPTSQQSFSREKLEQISMMPQPTIPARLQPPIGNEIFGSMPTASVSIATTAVPPALTAGAKAPSQQKIIEQEWLQSKYDIDVQDRVISPRSEPFTVTATTITSNELFELTPQFSLPIVRLFGGLFVHNCEESHYVTSGSMPLVAC
ncbi:hypothetical protein DINM_002009 [Dirofilaria immitis]|nr:hypothetical protein [Dirofilaria immitis]